MPFRTELKLRLSVRMLTKSCSYDGWSVPLLFDQLDKAYHGMALSVGADFRLFVRYLHNTSSRASDHFWLLHFEGASQPTFPPYPLAEYEPQATEVVRQDIAFHRQAHSDTTLSTIVQGAWALLLSRYSDCNDIVMGVTLSGRNTPVVGIDRMTGPTITTIPIRVQIDPDQSCRDWLRTFQTRMTEMTPYQHVGLQHIRRLSPDAQAACQIRSLLVIQPQPSASASGDSLIRREISANANNFHTCPITIVCDLTMDGAKLLVNFDPKLVGAPQMHRMLYQFEHLLQQLCSDVAVPVFSIPLASQRDQAEIERWNSTAPKIVDDCVHQLFEKSVEAQPEAISISSWDGNLTYHELDQFSSHIARQLSTDFEVKPGAYVPLCFEKSVWMVVAMMAVLKAGAAVVPFDPAHPTERLELMSQQVQASIILTSDTQGKRFTGLVDNVFVVSKIALDQSPEGYVDTTLLESPRPRGAAFINFTSGSTGRPKAVVTSHSAFCSSALANGSWLRLGPHSRYLQFSANAFDVHLGEILFTLIFGGTVCMPSEHERMNDISGAICRMNVNQACLTTSVASLLQPADVPTLTQLTLAGEKIRPENVHTWAAALEFNNLYGPAEASVFSTGTRAMRVKSDPNNIGYGVNTKTWVVDQHDHNILMAVGMVGELLLESPHLADGYLNDLAKTDAVFIVDPRWASSSTGVPRRFYKTGDLVRYNTDGSLNIIGRKDTQVKLRGQRIELEEIEHALRCNLPTKSQAIVNMVSVAGGKPALIAAVEVQALGSAESSKSCLIAALADLEPKLKSILPSYMVPSAFVSVDDMPVTVGGKIDRRRLVQSLQLLTKDHLLRFSSGTNMKEKPTSSAALLMQRLWAQVLRLDLDVIGAEDEFIQLGGDSTDAMRLVALARKSGLNLSVADIFRKQSLQRLSASSVSSKSHAVKEPYLPFSSLRVPGVHQESLLDHASSRLSIAKDEIEDILEATSFQASSISSAMTSSRGWTTHFVAQFTDNVDIVQLEEACRAVVAHHSILRTFFLGHRGKAFQIVLRAFAPEVLRLLNCADLSKSVADTIRTDLERAAFLGEAHVRFMLLQDEQHRTCLIMRISHAQYDGMCIPTIFKDLRAAYDGRSLPNGPSFASFTHSALKSYQSDEAETYWRNFLQGSTMRQISSYNRPRHKYPLNIVLSCVRRVTSLKAEGVTFANVLKAAWALTLAEICGEVDIVFGHLVSGRNLLLDNVEQVMGPCINFIPVRAQLDHMSTTKELLNSLHQQQLDAIPFELMPFQTIVDKCTDWPTWTRFSSTVQHQNLPEGYDLFEFSGGDCKVELVSQSPDLTDIAIVTTPQEDNILIELSYNERNVSKILAENALERIAHHIEAICDNHNQDLERQISEPALIRQIASPTRRYATPVHCAKTASQTLNCCSEIVKQAWRFCFPNLSSTKLDELDFMHEVAFYRLRGDLFAAAELADFFQHSGYRSVRIEDVLENPTISEQISFLASRGQG